ncbi:cupin domain-containing protein [Pseudidiomarina aestuarii]|uniref:cupin domain-containing protein n=1 Tax=Pseudidiomarina aestuarii TaxID=624146 RepID=UPI003A96EAF8
MTVRLNLDTKEFLQQYWQRQPLLIRGAFADFNDPIEPELLAGLAMEDGVDSRVIENHQGEWNVQHGPFTDYEAFGESGWTLLVQSVNEWFPAVQSLLQPFRFLPDWRTDDVMVSFATEHGGVGPHLDQYDVFIIQGTGTRHWRVGERVTAAAENCPHPDLKQLQTDFVATIDAVLTPGDMLYIPAGCPHEGIALEPSLNYSIGFRAPNSAEFIAALADVLHQTEQNYPRYRDPEALQAGSAFRVDSDQLNSVKSFVQRGLSEAQLEVALLQVMSQSKRPLPQPDEAISEAVLAQALVAELLLCRTPGSRILLGPQEEALYFAGERWPLETVQREFVTQLAEQWEDCELTDYASQLAHDHNRELLCELLQTGVFYLVQEEDEPS